MPAVMEGALRATPFPFTLSLWRWAALRLWKILEAEVLWEWRRTKAGVLERLAHSIV
jgi:hypothetical protein